MTNAKIISVNIISIVFFKCVLTTSYDEWGLENTNLSVCGNISRYAWAILTDENPFIHRFCYAMLFLHLILSRFLVEFRITYPINIKTQEIIANIAKLNAISNDDISKNLD